MAEPFENLMRGGQPQQDPRYQQGQNYFPPLTPEQIAALQRQAISTETFSPFDMLMGGGIGAIAGRAVGRGMGHVADFMVPTGPAAANWAGRAGTLLGGLAGVGGPNQAAQDRARMNTIRDAEGQPGGFYGQMPRR